MSLNIPSDKRTITEVGTHQLNTRHYKECVDKHGLDPAWILANCKTYLANEATQYLGYTAKSDGIWLKGCNGQGQFKPDERWLSEKDKAEGKKKAPKYRSQTGEYDAMLPTDPNNPHYWDDIKALKEHCYQIDGHPYIVVTEGFFKAIAGCLNGVPTIALLGVEMGLTSAKSDLQGKRYLVPTLERFARAGFGFIYAFDADCATNNFVIEAQRKLVHQLKKFNVQMYNATGLWTVAEGNGMDDYIQANGADKFKREVLGKVVDIEAWEKQFEQPQVTISPDDSDYIGDGTVESSVLNSLFANGEGNWATREDTFYNYLKGCWHSVSNKKITKMIAVKCKSAYELRQCKDGSVKKVFPYAKESHKQSAFKFCRDILHTENLPANRHLRAFLNCSVDLRTGESIPHDKTHFLTTQIASDYLPGQPCPQIFLDFIKSAYGEDLIEPIRAYTSMLLDPTAPYGFFVHLMGPSGSGKGTLLRLWGEMYGLDHLRSGDFKNLSTAEGRHQYLTNAALFTVPDVGGYVQGLKPFYELVDNGPMAGRSLFSSNGYNKQWAARFVIASVDHLQIENAGDGWDRRCLPLPTKPRAGIIDPHLGSKLAEVKGQIISWALAMPREERDRIVSLPSTNERVLELKQDAAISGDPIRAFVDLCLRPAENSQKIHSHELHSKFIAFAQSHGYQSQGMSKLVNHLKTFLSAHYVPRRRGQNREMISACWKNMRFGFGAFVDMSFQGGDGDGRGNDYQPEPEWKCLKSECCEGGLLAFSEFETDATSELPLWDTPP